MCNQLASLGPGTCFKISPHFSNSLKTMLVSPGENLQKKSIVKKTHIAIYKYKIKLCKVHFTSKISFDFFFRDLCDRQ